jgi:uncharacterized small protein (DUF1192 family)
MSIAESQKLKLLSEESQKQSGQIAELLAQLAVVNAEIERLKQEPEKRGPGRPRKDAN